MSVYIGLIVASLMPALFSSGIFLLDKYTKFKNLKPIIKEVLIGIVFGGLAVLGTEFGVKTDTGAVINTRDGAVLTASFFFGWKAGIIAGVIGGVERWLCVYWGGGMFTRLACTISTILAGLLGALIKKVMLKDKKPNWIIAFVLAIVMETIHMMMVFFTNFNTPDQAIEVVKLCTPLMLGLNGLSVLLSSLALTLLNKERLFKKSDILTIHARIRLLLLGTVVVAFILSSTFIYYFQHRIALTQTETKLSQVTEDIVSDVKSRTNNYMIDDIRSAIVDEYENGETVSSIINSHEYKEFYFISLESLNYGYVINSNIENKINNDLSNTEEIKSLFDIESNTLTSLALCESISSDSLIKYFGYKTNKGLYIVGISENNYSSIISTLISDVAEYRRIESTGFVVITDKLNNTMSAPSWFKENNSSFYVELDDGLNSLKLNNSENEETEYYGLFISEEGYHLYAFISSEEALEVESITVYMNTFLEIIIFAFIFVQIFIVLRSIVTDKIDKINDSLKVITSGNLNEVIDVKDTYEFRELSNDINMTVDSLKNYIHEAELRNEQEMELAKNIQKSALPTVTPKILSKKFMDIYASMNAAKEVGGDFYDFYLTDDNTLNILIADVSGKGIPAAMFMMKAKAMLRALTEKGLPIEDVFTEANKELCESNEAGMFITCWQAQINLLTGDMKLVNAGHNPPLLKSDNGKYEYLKSKAGFVLAGLDNFKYKANELHLNEHDELFLYTDGVTEATNINHELLGEDRLKEVLNEKNYESSKELSDRVFNEVIEFTGDAPQFDDVTMLSFMFKCRPLIKEMEAEETSIETITSYTEFIEDALNSIDVNPKDIMKINIAIDEIVSNIVNHGYKGKLGYTKIRLHQSDDLSSLALTFIDKGIPYNPITEKDPDVTKSLEEREVGGLGLYMVKKSMDDMKYKYVDGKNVLTIIKNIK